MRNSTVTAGWRTTRLFSMFTLTMLLCFAFAAPFRTQAQCLLLPLELSNRVANSNVIVEGKVMQSQSFWDASHSMIYTAHKVELNKIFKGSVSSNTITVLTQGGRVNDYMIVVNPSLKLSEGQSAIFMTNGEPMINPYGSQVYVPYGAPQGCIKLSYSENKGNDPFNVYNNIQTAVYDKIVALVGQPYNPVKPTTANQGPIAPMAVPVISSFSPTSINAGNNETLTINGSNFGTTVGSRKISFPNPDDGGASYVDMDASMITSWSNTQIVIKMPGDAGTGKFKVTNGTGETGTSATDLTVNYHRISLQNGTLPTRLVGIGGNTIKFTYNASFAANTAAKSCYERAMETWRCGTFVNFGVNTGTSSIACNATDGVNIVTFTAGSCTLPAGVLGVTSSGYTSCNGTTWYPDEIDQVFVANPGGSGWNFTTAATSLSKVDFQSVVTHELGHAHQLGHVINTAVIMHYAIGPGEDLRNLASASDVAGGTNIVGISSVAACSQPALTPLNSGNCPITPATSAPVADFSADVTNPALNQTVTFTDLSTNTPTSWNWVFTPNNVSFQGGTLATSKNPQVKFTAAGTYQVALTATNAIGSNTATKTAYITVSATAAYCAALHGDVANNEGTALDDYIDDVKLGAINNVGTGATGGPTYTDYSATQVATLVIGSAFTITVKNGNYGDNNSYITAFIDYNNDGDFADANERVGQVVALTANANFTINATVPAGTAAGTTKMRVRRVYDNVTPVTVDPCNLYTYGETEDYGIVLATSAAPVADFSADDVTALVNQTITFSDLSSNTPTSWSWAISPGTFTYTGGTSATSQNPQVQFTAVGTYQVALTATNATGSNTATKPAYITVSATATYCTPLHGTTATTGTGDGDFINGVSLGTINNQNTGTQGGPTYTDYSATISTNLNISTAYTLAVTNGSYGDANCYMLGFIDFNADGDFADAGERIGQAVVASAGAVGNIAFTVPASATAGPTRLRVRRIYGTTPASIDACLLSTYGETEDYTVNLVAVVGPIVDFKADDTTPMMTTQVVNFTDLTAGSPTSWSWAVSPGTFSYSGGTTATSQNPKMTFNAAGTYNVTLTATNASGTNNLTKTAYITVLAPGSCDTLYYPAAATQTAYVLGAGPANGYFPGHNDSNIEQYANFYANPGYTYINNVFYNFAEAKTLNPTTSKVTAFVRLADGAGGSPGTLVASQDVLIQDIADNITAGFVTAVDFGGSLNVGGADFFAGYQLYYGTPGDTVILFTATINAPPVNHAWALNPVSGAWSPVSGLLTGVNSTEYSVWPQMGDIPDAIYTPSATTVCQGKTVTFTSTSTNVAQTFWFFDGGTPATAQNVNSQVVTYSTPGTYDVALYVSGSCGGLDSLVSVGQITVTAPPTITVNNSSPTVCSGGSSSLTASGANTYAWAPATGLSATTGTTVTASPSATTTYTVTGTTSAGCTNTTTVTVTVAANLTVSVSPSSPSVCSGVAAALTASGGTTYAWAPATGLSATTGASVNANPSTTTTYTVTATSGACTGTATVTVTVNAAPTVSVSPSAPSVCAGGNSALTASGAATYAWAPATGLSATSGANVTATPSTTTTYTVTGTNAAGCTATSTVTVTVNAAPSVSVSPASPSVCPGGNSALTASGATTYAWAPSTGLSATTGANVTATPSATTTYTVTGTTAGCTGTATVTVTVSAAVSVTVSGTGAICAGSNTSLTASGAATYAWAPATGLSATTGATVTANPSATTTYTVTGTNAAGCTGTATKTVTVNAAPTISATAASPTICASGSTSITASGGVTYAWAPATGLSSTSGSPVTANPTATTTYTVTGTDINGCTSTGTVTVTVQSLPAVPFTATPATVCTGGAVTVTATGIPLPGAVYNWDFAGGTATPGTGAGPHTVTYASGGAKNITLTVTSNGCTTPVSTQTVNVSTPLGAPVANCGNTTLNSVQFTWAAVTGATGYEVSTDGGATFAAASPGPLSHTVNGLTAGQTVTLVVRALGAAPCGNSANSAPVTCTAQNCTAVTFTAPAPVSICNGASTTLSITNISSANTSIAWSNGDVGATISVSPTATTTYTYTITDNNQPGCSPTTGTVVVTVNQAATATLSANNTTVCTGAAVTVTFTGNAAAGATYTWDFAGGVATPGTGAGPHSVVFSTGGAKNITLALNNNNGCASANANINITVNSAPAAPVVSCGSSTTTSVTFTWAAVSGATSYEVSTNGTTFSPASPGPLSHTVTGLTSGQTVNLVVRGIGGSCGNGAVSAPVTCTAINCTPVTFTASPAASICSGSSATLSLSNLVPANANVAWNTGATGASITVSPTATTTYTYSVSDPAQPACSPTTGTITVTVANNATASFTLSSATTCEGQSVTATFTGSAAPGAVFTWNAGSGTVTPGTGSGPQTIVFNTFGSKTITLSVDNGGGCTPATATQNLTVLPVPVAPSVSCGNPTPTSVTFEWSAVAGALSYQVSTDGGATFVAASPGPLSHTINGLTVGQSATVIVRAVSATCGNGAASAPVTCVAGNCTPITFTSSPDVTVCAGELVTLNISNINIPNPGVVWSGNGTVVNPTTYTIVATDTIQVTVTVANLDAQQCPQKTYTFTINANPIPVPTFTIDAFTTCEGTDQTITFTGSASANAVYSWDFGGGVIVSGSGAGPYIVRWDSLGDKNVILNVTDNGCSDSHQEQIFVSPKLPAPIVSCGQTSDTQIEFIWNAITGATGYEISIDGAPFIPVNGTTSHTLTGLTANQAVVVIVRATGNTPCNVGAGSVGHTCLAVACQPIVYNITADPTICPGSSAVIEITNPSQPNLQVSWFGTGNVDPNNQFKFVANPNSNGQVVITIINLDQPNCPAVKDTVFVTVATNCPTANFNVSATTICSTNPITVTYIGTAGAGATYNWDFDGATVLSGAGQGPYSLVWPTPGLKTITLTVTQNGLTSQAFSKTVVVSSGVVITATATDATALGNDGSIATTVTGGIQPYTYKLNTAGFVTSGTFNNLTPGDYQVIVRDSIGCTDTTTVSVGGPGARGNASLTNVSLYPNPNSGAFTLDITNLNDAKATINVVDMLGQVVYTEELSANAGAINRSLQLNLAVGMYHLQVKTSTEVLTQKLVVK